MGFIRMFISFPGALFQGHGLHRLVRAKVVILVGPCVRPPDFAAFLALELKHN